MAKYIVKKKRPKAALGADGAIMAAATLASAAINSSATASAAKAQADATKAASQQQADALIAQNENDNKLQQQMLEFQKNENKIQREYEKNAQLNTVMQTAGDNQDELNAMRRIKVAKGGEVKSGNNFKITDGGGARYIGTTPQGNKLYELVGDTHKEYHKTPAGRYKSGIGVKTPGGTIEGEGGELLLEDNDSIKFISKHNVEGSNPKQEVIAGKEPEQAFADQERRKAAKSVNKTPVGRINKRPKAYNGTIGQFILGKDTYGKLSGDAQTMADAGLTGLAVNTGANIAGAGITMLGNSIASKAMRNANSQARDIIVNAYNRMKGIDMSNLRSEDYKASHAMANLENTRVDDTVDRAGVERSILRSRNAIDRNVASDIARTKALQDIEVGRGDAISKISQNTARIEQERRARNTATANQVNQFNVQQDNAARDKYNQQHLALLQYNNNIENDKIAGIAAAKANAVTGNAGIKSDTYKANASSVAGVANNLNKSLNNLANTVLKGDAEYKQLFAGLSPENKVSEADRTGNIDFLKGMYDLYKGKTDDTGKNMANYIKRVLDKHGVKVE